MNNIRNKRLAALLQEEISKIILMDIHEPELKYVSVIKLELTKDLKLAKVFLSSFESIEDDEDVKNKHQELLNLIYKYKGLIKKELCNRIKIRQMPELKFVYDDTLEYVQNISEIIDNIQED